jgi:dolichyl-phosphate beta-glucosyltransferase
MAKQLSLIVPVYNHKVTALPGVHRLERYLRGVSPDFEIILVDDGSSPPERITQAELPPGVALLRGEANRGKGHAVKRGMLEAQGACRIYTDADLPYDLSFIPAALKLVESGHFHFVAGDRTHKGSVYETSITRLRRFTSFALAKLLQLGIVGGVLDSQCGFKAFSAALAERLFPLLRIERFGFDVEIFYLLSKYSISVRRLPVRFCCADASSVKPLRDGFRTALDILRIPLRWHLGGYSSRELAQFEIGRYWEEPAAVSSETP